MPRVSIAVVLLLVVVSGSGFARSFGKKGIKITAFAVGDGMPPIGTPPMGEVSVENGDFLILSNVPTHPTVGEGVDEVTLWNFDFTGDPNLARFLRSRKPITSADLVFVRKPVVQSADSDALWIQATVANFVELEPFVVPGDMEVLPGEWEVVAYDLLSVYKPDEIRDALLLKAEGEDLVGFNFRLLSDTRRGDIPMIYGDDAIVRFAMLNLAIGKR